MKRHFCDICGREICDRNGRHVAITDLDGQIRDWRDTADYEEICLKCAYGIVMHIGIMKEWYKKRPIRDGG